MFYEKNGINASGPVLRLFCCLFSTCHTETWSLITQLTLISSMVATMTRMNTGATRPFFQRSKLVQIT